MKNKSARQKISNKLLEQLIRPYQIDVAERLLNTKSVQDVQLTGADVQTESSECYAGSLVTFVANIAANNKRSEIEEELDTLLTSLSQEGLIPKFLTHRVYGDRNHYELAFCPMPMIDKNGRLVLENAVRLVCHR